MTATTNFLTVDPTKTNMMDDDDYSSYLQRENGVGSGMAISSFHNKVFYQSSIMVAALSQVLVNRGFTVSDSSFSDLVTVLSDFMSNSGDTMTGPLILSADPTAALGAATKQYADTKAPGGYGLGTYATDISNLDLNTSRGNGFFKGNNMTNAPTTGWYFIYNITHNATYSSQIAISFNIDNTSNIIYSRVCNGGGWSAWNQVAMVNSNITGNAATATALKTSRSIGASGDATGSVSFNGTIDAVIPITLASSGVAAGTYTKITVDSKGRATGGTTLSASDVPTLNQNTTGSAATLSTALAIALGGTGLTVGAAPAGYGLGTYEPSLSINLNDFLYCGFYYVNNSTLNCPAGYPYGHLLVQSVSTNSIKQTYDTVPSGITFTRFLYNGTWSAWTQIATVVASSFGTNGYIKWSNGYTEQWGEVTDVTSTNAGAFVTVTFPLAFTSIANVHGWVGGVQNSDTDINTYSRSTTGAVLTADNSYGSSTSGIALGWRAWGTI